MDQSSVLLSNLLIVLLCLYSAACILKNSNFVPLTNNNNTHFDSKVHFDSYNFFFRDKIYQSVDCKQSLSFPHNQSNLEVRAAKLQAKTV